MNIANKLTVSRVIMIPVFLVFILVPMNLGTSVRLAGTSISVAHLIATIIFIVASLTDWLDGYLARKLKLVSNFGKFLDPLADKLLVMAALVSLVQLAVIPGWMVIVILAREFAVTGLRLVAVEEGLVIAASKIAKWKTTFQMLAIIILLLNNFPFSLQGFPLGQFLIWIAVILTVISGWDYFSKNKQIMIKTR